MVRATPLEQVVSHSHRLSQKFSIQEQLLYRNVQRFRGGLVFKAHRLLYHSTLGSRVIKKKKKTGPPNHHDDKVDSDQ